MERTQGWEQRLNAMMMAAINTPHEWGVHDCVTFAADAVEAMTGVDPIADLRGEWAGPLSARRLLTDEGVDTIGDMAAKRLPEIPVSMARRGDIVFCDSDEGGFLGVMQGRSIVGPAGIGLVHVPVNQALRAFRVGV